MSAAKEDNNAMPAGVTADGKEADAKAAVV